MWSGRYYATANVARRFEQSSTSGISYEPTQQYAVEAASATCGAMFTLFNQERNMHMYLTTLIVKVLYLSASVLFKLLRGCSAARQEIGCQLSIRVTNHVQERPFGIRCPLNQIVWTSCLAWGPTSKFHFNRPCDGREPSSQY